MDSRLIEFILIYSRFVIVTAAECECEPNTPINLTQSNPLFLLSSPTNDTTNDTSSYCNNLNCHWEIWVPEGHVLHVDSHVQLRPGAGDQLTFADRNSKMPFLRVNDSTPLNRTVSSATQSVLVDFSSGFVPDTTGELDNGWWMANLSIFNLTFQDPITRNLTPDQPSFYVPTRDFGIYAVLTVIGNPNAKSYGGLEMWIGAFPDTYNAEFTNAMDFVVIDGQSTVTGKVLGRLDDFAIIGAFGAPESPIPVKAESNSFTILLLNSSSNPFSPALDVILYFRQSLVPDPCQTHPIVAVPTGENGLIVTETANPTSTARCPIVIIPFSLPQNMSNRLKIKTLTYTGGVPGHLIGGGEPNTTANVSDLVLIDFSASATDQWIGAAVYGRIFTLLIPANGSLSFSFTTSFGAVQQVEGGTGLTGIIMSTNYPFSNDETRLPNVTYAWSSSGNNNQQKLLISMDLNKIDLGKASRLEIDPFLKDTSAVLLMVGNSSAGQNTKQFCTNYFEVTYWPTGSNQTGFLIRYETGDPCNEDDGDRGVTIAGQLRTFGFFHRRDLSLV